MQMIFRRVKRAWIAFWNEPTVVEEEKPEPEKKEEPKPPPNRAEEWANIMEKRPRKELSRWVTLSMGDHGSLTIMSYGGLGQDVEKIVLNMAEVENALPFLIEYYQRRHYYGIVPYSVRKV